MQPWTRRHKRAHQPRARPLQVRFLAIASATASGVLKAMLIPSSWYNIPATRAASRNAFCSSVSAGMLVMSQVSGSKKAPGGVPSVGCSSCGSRRRDTLVNSSWRTSDEVADIALRTLSGIASVASFLINVLRNRSSVAALDRPGRASSCSAHCSASETSQGGRPSWSLRHIVWHHEWTFLRRRAMA